MIGMFNDFTEHLETKLITLNRKIDNISANLVILEMKLNSVNSTLLSNDIGADVNLNTVEQHNQVMTVPEMLNVDKDGINVQDDTKIYTTETVIDQTTTSQHQQKEQNDSSSSEPETNLSNNNNSEQNESLEMYKRMLRFGVNENAVRQKMVIDGIEPSLLNL